jgi:hypothetical protein
VSDCFRPDSDPPGLQGEPLVPMYRKLKMASDIPNFLRPLILFILYLLGEGTSAPGDSTTTPLSNSLSILFVLGLLGEGTRL